MAETSNYVGDFTAPDTSVTAVDTSSSAFQVTWAGADNLGGSGLKTVNLYVQVDSSPVALFASIPVTTGTTGGTTTYQVSQDGKQHSYRFFSVGIDARGNTEAAPNGLDSDQVVPPTPPARPR